MRINIKDIKIKKEYYKRVPRMKPDDAKAFKESVVQNGIQEPLVLNQDLVLLDGHSRYDEAKEQGIKMVPYRTKKFDDELLEKKYVAECNLARRHLTNFQKIELGMYLIEIEKLYAKQRMSEGGKGQKVDSNDPTLSSGKVTDIIATRIGTSGTTVMRGKYVIENATNEQKEKLRDGKTTINTIYNILTRKEKNLPKVELPDGQWSVVLCDVPIKFDNEFPRGASSNNYDTMTIPELIIGEFNGQDVRECFAKDCIIFAWFQASTIFDAKDILESWGFKCITNIIWDKERSGNGTWLDNRHEHLVIAVKGDMPLPTIRLPSIIKEKPENRIHSSKPTRFYDIVENLYPNRKYLDLFSRYQHNENWTCFGNELQKEV